MQFELQCLCCARTFPLPPNSPAAIVLDQLREEGPWRSLVDGETIEDRVYSALCEQDAVHCPKCNGPVTACEASLGRFAAEMLAEW